MKKITASIMLLALFACNGEKSNEPAATKKVLCGDSVDVEMFDENGTAFTVRQPGKCDTVEVTEE